MTICFLCFTGIDYTEDEAGSRLNHFLRDAQKTIYRYEGSINKLNVGDKGSVLLILFGAPPFVHPDDEARAVACALDLRQVAFEHRLDVQVGLSAGPVFLGPLGATRRREYTVIGDAVTFLSNNWDPSQSDKSYKYRSATKTEVNLSFVTGDLKPDGTNYGGGLENLPRFLEDWNGAEFKIRGSMIEMWRSRQATGTWRYIQAYDAYYSAPSRNWGFDNDLSDPNKLPPGTPMVRVFNRTGWRQEQVAVAQAPA